MSNTSNNLTIVPIVSALEKAFNTLNNRFYDGKLSRPVITLAEGSKMRAYGWFTIREVWHDNNDNSACELNISSDYLKRDFSEIVRTLAHEMVHCANHSEGIQDCARAGQRNNKYFRIMAEKHGMVWHEPQTDDEKAYYQKYGFSDVRFSDEVKDEVLEMLSFLRESITLYRDETKNEKKKSKNNVIKYICPVCGCSCRATKEINIHCNECVEDMIVG